MNLDNNLVRIAALESQRDAALAEVARLRGVARRLRHLWGTAATDDRGQEPGTPDDMDALVRRRDRAYAEFRVQRAAKTWRASWGSKPVAQAGLDLAAAVDALLAAEAAEQEASDA